MAGAAEPFDKAVAKNCPSNGRYYFCERIGEDGQPSRFPIDKALMVQPFEWPVGAKAGAWMIRYCRDQRAEEIIPHVAGRQQVIAHLQYPSEVCDRPDGASDAALLAALTTESPIEDDEEGSLKTARIDAKKRELALDLVAKEQRVVRRGAVNKELAEGFLLNRAHRLEVRDQSEAMFRVQNQTIAMSERTLVLIEKIQEGMGRVAELEKAVAQRAATPPPPVDYTPVLHGVVAAIRDIGVSALQREHKLKPRSEEEAAPVKAALTDKPSASAQVNEMEQPMPPALGTVPKAPALTAPPVPTATPSAQPDVTELMARLARLEAERDRMASELAAERKRQEILTELSAGVPPSKAQMRSESSIQPGSVQPESSASPPLARTSLRESDYVEEPHAQNSERGSEPQHSIEPSDAQDRPATPADGTPRQPTELREQKESGVPGPPRESGRAEVSERRSVSADPTSLVIEPVILPPRAADVTSPFTPKTPRNSPCPCGSGRKYKKCCLPKDQQAAFTEAAVARQRALRETAPIHSATDGKVPSTTPPAPSIRSDSSLSGSSGRGEGLATRTAAQSSTATTGAKQKDAEAPPCVESSAAAISNSPAAGSTASPRPDPVAGTSIKPPAESGTSVPKKAEEPSAPPDILPGMLGEHIQELLVNAIAGRMLANPDAPIPSPQVPRVDLVEQVIVAPSKMDSETALKLLKDGTALETLGAFLFFNPAVRDLLSRRGK